MIENTGQRDPMLHLLGSMSDGPEKYITDMEAAGQRQLVASQQIPIKGSNDLEALGFTLGEPVDDLFRTAQLPEGWTKRGSDHAMWSYIDDEHGRERVAVFYKAAYYDRDAFCRVNTVFGYVSKQLYTGGRPVLDEHWATAEAVVEAAKACIARELETMELYSRPDVAARMGDRAEQRVAEATAEIGKAQTLIAQVTS